VICIERSGIDRQKARLTRAFTALKVHSWLASGPEAIQDRYSRFPKDSGGSPLSAGDLMCATGA
jgi:hypothetical protein